MKSKIIKFLLFLVFIIMIIFLFKVNVKLTKEEKKPEIENSSRVSLLDVNSDLVLSLYKKLNLDLINNNCSQDVNCLYNSNYRFMYFNRESEVLSNEEMLYLVFNDLYNENNYYIDNDKIIFDKVAVEDKIKKLFISYEFTDLGSSFKTSLCGIVDYTFTGKTYELKFSECNETVREIGFTKIIDAYKEENTIKINVSAFYAKTSKKNYDFDDNIFKFYNFFSDNPLGDTSYNTLIKNNQEFFVNYGFNKYTFEFELLEDDYHLKTITCNVKNV